MKLNPFDLLADLEGADADATVNATASPAVRLKSPPSARPKTRLDARPDATTHRARSASPASPHAPAHKATLYVHDNSNQRACCLTVPLASLASTRTLAKFLKNKGFTAARTSLLTAHEDRVPCDLHVIPMDSPAPILPTRALTADVILHLFIAHDAAPSPAASLAAPSLLQAFANVHPDCYKTLAECAEQPLLQTPFGHVPVDFQTYLEAAFRASVAANAILYNDCDKTNLKAEWCAWNTGLTWKQHPAASSTSLATPDAHSGYIYLFFKRSLSRTTKERLASFSVDCARQAKPWTMNKPKPVSDVAQWLNGAAVPQPPPADLLAACAATQPAPAPVRPLAVPARRSLDESAHPATPTFSEASLGHPSDLASECSSVSHTLDAPLTPTAAASTPTLAAAHLPNPTLPALRTPDSTSSKQGKGRRRRGSKRSNLSRGSTGSPASSSPGEPSTPTQDDVQKHKQMEADIDDLASALQQACSASALKTCGWISSIHDPAAPVAVAGPASNAWAGQLRWVL